MTKYLHKVKGRKNWHICLELQSRLLSFLIKKLVHNYQSGCALLILAKWIKLKPAKCMLIIMNSHFCNQELLTEVSDVNALRYVSEVDQSRDIEISQCWMEDHAHKLKLAMEYTSQLFGVKFLFWVCQSECWIMHVNLWRTLYISAYITISFFCFQCETVIELTWLLLAMLVVLKNMSIQCLMSM